MYIAETRVSPKEVIHIRGFLFYYCRYLSLFIIPVARYQSHASGRAIGSTELRTFPTISCLTLRVDEIGQEFGVGRREWRVCRLYKCPCIEQGLNRK
jgi:hypothetical protein